MATSIAELVAAMRKHGKRKADESDSEDEISGVTNRGNKLKKKARYVHEGQLAPPSGPEVYKETITHAGYQRDIISRRPVVYDEDGFEIDSEDEDQEHQEAIAVANDLYPYADVRIEDLLAPLTRPADLPTHPTLSLAFTSTPLTELTRNAREMWQKEQASLWKMKKLLQKLSGDQVWVPSEMMETSDDIALFDDGRSGYREHVHDRVNLNIEAIEEGLAVKVIAAAESALNKSLEALQALEVPQIEIAAEDTLAEDDVAMIEAPTVEVQVSETTPTATSDAEKPESRQETKDKPAQKISDEHQPPAESVEQADAEEPKIQILVEGVDNSEKVPDGMEVTVIGDDGLPEDPEEDPAPRRMRTRAQAQAASDENTTSRNRSLTPESNESYVHPYFLPPSSAHADRDIGLPAQEAEDTRRLLQLYVQKQEEVCRGARRLYDGLLKADSMRAEVFKWAKADGHIGEMSDGEDWYDKEEWGLTEDLKKGQDEEEEDAATTAKKTRTRRQ